MTFYSLSKEEFQYLFNKKQIEDYKKQLKVKRLILPSKINLKDITVVDSAELNNNKKYYAKKCLTYLSLPVFSKNRDYAIIEYHSGFKFWDTIKSGIVIYKKEKGKWIRFREITLGIS